MATPGSALSNQFHFSTATLCVAPMADQLIINPANHSLGLVKGLQVSAETSKIDLTQGITNEIVSTVVNSVNITGSCEVYEYTAKNLAYGLGLDGSGLTVKPAADALAGAVAAAATTVTVAADKTAVYPVGTWIFLQEGSGEAIHIARISAVAFASVTTITFAGSTPTRRCRTMSIVRRRSGRHKGGMRVVPA
jgi:hypothetical protein